MLNAEIFQLVSQTFVTSFQSALYIRLISIKIAPAKAVAPPYAHVATQPCEFNIAPPIGVPVRPPMLIIAKPIPIRVPIRPLFGESETKHVGGSDTKDPEKKPYRMQITMMLATL